MPISYGAGKFQPPQASPKVLATGTASATSAQVYLVPRGTNTELTFFSIYNGDATTATDVDVFVVDAAAASTRVFRSSSLAVGATLWIFSNESGLYLQPGWSLNLECSEGADVSYCLSGIEYRIPVGGST